MNYISLFTGIGGFDLALDDLGMNCAGQSEVDKQCISVLRHRFGETRQLGDIRGITASNIQLDSIDLAVGGFPCTDLSVAGRRAGLAGKQSGLWFEFRRVIMEHYPRWVIIENVPGLLSANGGLDFSVLVGGLTGVIPAVPDKGWKSAGYAAGSPGLYNIAWRVLDSQYFGVPQRRRRVFIVGHLSDPYAPAEVLLERNGLPWDHQAGAEEIQEISAISSSSAFLLNYSSGDAGADRFAAGTVTPYPGETAYAVNGVGSKFGSGRHNQDTFIVYHNKQQSGEIREYENFSPSVTRQWGTGGNNVPFLVDRAPEQHVFSPHSHYIYEQDGFVNTLQNRQNRQDGSMTLIASRAGAPGQDAENWRELGFSDDEEYAVRKLTAMECERLQGFPDDFSRWGVGKDGKLVEISDSARYRMLGNAVTVPVVRWIARRIVAYGRIFRL